MCSIKTSQRLLKSIVMLLALGTSCVHASSKYTSVGSITSYNGGIPFFEPRGIAFSPDGAYVYIVNSDYGTAHVNAAAVCAFSTSDNLYKGKYGTSAADNIDGPHGIAVNEEGGSTYMYIGNVGHGGGANGLIKYQINAADLAGVGAVTINQALVATALNPQGIAIHGSTVYLGSNADQIQKFKTADLTADGAGFNPAGAKGVAFDSRGILYAAAGTTLGRYNATDGSALSAVPGAIANPYGVAVAPSGHILLVDSNQHDIIVYKANGLPAFTISNVGSLGIGGSELTYVAVHPTTGRVYATSGGADSTVYMFDVPSFRPPGQILQSLPTPPPPAVANVVTTMAQTNAVYQTAISTLDTPGLELAAAQYTTPNTTPNQETSISSNVTVLNVTQSQLDLLQMNHISPVASVGFEQSHRALTQLQSLGAQQQLQKLSKLKNFSRAREKEESDAIYASTPSISIIDDEHVSFWTQGTYSKTKTAAADGVDPNKGIINSFTLGTDWKLGKSSRIGILAGASSTRVYDTLNASKDTAKKIYTGIYAAHYWGDRKDTFLPSWDVTAIAGKGLSYHYRDVSIPGYPLVAYSKNHFWDFVVRNRFSLPIKFSDCTSATPYVSFGWMFVNEDKIQESNAEDFNQTRPKQQYQVIELGSGLQLSTQFKQSFGIVIPTLRFGTSMTKSLRSKKWLNVGLAGGTSYEVEQQPLKTNTLNLGGSIALQSYGNSSILAGYMGSFSGKYKKHEVVAELKITF